MAHNYDWEQAAHQSYKKVCYSSASNNTASFGNRSDMYHQDHPTSNLTVMIQQDISSYSRPAILAQLSTLFSFHVRLLSRLCLCHTCDPYGPRPYAGVASGLALRQRRVDPRHAGVRPRSVRSLRISLHITYCIFLLHAVMFRDQRRSSMGICFQTPAHERSGLSHLLAV